MVDEPVHVVAAVIEDLRGRILLTRRTAGREFAGLWEFPGGKVEPGETAHDALARELHEELGIAIGASSPLIDVPCSTPRKRLRLDVYRLAGWDGRPRGREGQATAWVTRGRLARYAMPPADRAVVAALLLPGAMLVTPEPDGLSAEDFAHRIADAAAATAGAVCQPPLIQLRARSMAPQQLRATATHLLRILGPGNASRLLLNGAPAVATALGVGLHLTSAQLLATAPAPATPTAGMPIAAVPTSPAPGGSGRRRGRLLGASCHSVAELLHAQAIGADYAVLGPVAATRSHPDARPIGWDRFRQWRESVTLPVFALGGLSMQDFAMARAHGAQGIAAIRSFWLPQRARPD